jgi:hypothetical protein
MESFPPSYVWGMKCSLTDLVNISLNHLAKPITKPIAKFDSQNL